MGAEKRGKGESALYIQVAKGNFVSKSDSNDPDAFRRTYEDDDGNEQEKWENRYTRVTGHITGLTIEDGKFGEELQIKVEDGTDKTIITLKTDSDYFLDFARRLKNTDLTKPVSLSAYEFEPENGKRARRGISIKQDGETVKDGYWDGKKKLHGIPSVSKEEAEDFDGDDWKMHFIKVRKFLKKEIQNTVLPKYNGVVDTVEEVPVKKQKTQAQAAGAADDLPF